MKALMLAILLTTIPAPPSGLTVVEISPIEQAARWAQSTNGYAPGYIIATEIKQDTWIVNWYPVPIVTLGACDNDTDCESNAQDGCDAAGHSGCDSDGENCAPVTGVSQNGCICGGHCARNNAQYFEICNNPGC